MGKPKVNSTSQETYISCQFNRSMTTLSSSNSSWPASSQETSADSELCQQLQQLNKDVDSTLEFVCGVNDIVCSSVLANVCLAVLGFLAIIGLSLGVRYLSDCPVQPKIPIFLFVDGSFSLLKVVHVLWTNSRKRSYSSFTSESSSDKSQSAVQIVDGVLNIFLVVWQILGAYWALSVWCPYWSPPLHEPNNWCEQAVYVFALVQLCLAASIVLGRAVCQACLAVCYKCTSVFETGV